jgi:hypothetical protein
MSLSSVVNSAHHIKRLHFGAGCGRSIAYQFRNPWFEESRQVRTHAQVIVACDFFVAVTSTFRLLYVFVVIEHRSRRLSHCNVTAHPSAV